MSLFAGLTDADFEAYAPSKWRSKVYNLERLKAKERLLVLGRALAPTLAPVAAATPGEAAPLSLAASLDHPSHTNHQQVEAQHLYFSRNEDARRELDRIIERGQTLASRIEDPTPQRNHVFLAVSLHHDRLELALRLHPDARVDRENLVHRLEDHFEREKLLTLLRRLPEGFRYGLAPDAMQDAHAVDDAALEALLERFGRSAPAQPAGGSPATTAAGGGAGGLGSAFLGGLAGGVGAAGGPRSGLGGWAASLPGTAPAPATPFLQAVLCLPRAEAIAAGASLGERAATALGALLPIYQFIAWARDNDYVSMRDMLQRERQVKRQRGLARNDEVRVVRGMFSGKSGVIQEIDARGGLKLLVGKLAIKVDAEDVVKG